MSDPETPRKPRVLVVKLSSLGDIFHVLPAVHGLKQGLSATVDWAVQQEYAGLVRCFEDVDEVIPTSRRAFFRNLPALLRTLRPRHYDYVIDLQGLLKSSVVAGMARGRRTIGPSYHREGSRLFYGEVAGARDLQRHAVVQAMDVVRHLGLEDGETRFPVAFPAKTLGGGGRHVGLLPRSRWESKNWPPGHFAELGRRLIRENDITVYLLGGGDDASACEQIVAEISDSRAANLAGQLDLGELGGVLQALDLLVSNDSGPVHMAAAVSTPCLVLFGPTDPARTGPFGESHRVIQAPPPCQPCYDRNCRRHGDSCLGKISPDEVARAVLQMLGLPA